MEQQEAKRRGLDELRDLRKEVDVLRAEMTVMRQAMEAALVRWDTVQAPDYSQEFGMVYQSVDQLEQRLGSVECTQLVADPGEILRRVEKACAGQIQIAVDALDCTRYQYDENNKALKKHLAQVRHIAKFLVLALAALFGGIVLGALDNWVYG